VGKKPSKLLREEVMLIGLCNVEQKKKEDKMSRGKIEGDLRKRATSGPGWIRSSTRLAGGTFPITVGSGKIYEGCHGRG